LVDSNFYVLSPGLYISSKDILTKKIETQNTKECFDPKEIAAESKLENESGTSNIKPKTYLDYRGITTVGSHHYIREAGWCLIVKADLSEILSASTGITTLIFVVSGLIFILLLPIIYIASNRITKPILCLKKGMSEVEKGKFDIKIENTSDDEIGELSRLFEKMAATLGASKADIEKKVVEQTEEINRQTKDLVDQRSAILNILEDTEVQKRKAEKSSDDLTKFKLALENASDQVVITDIEGIVIYSNRAVETITGYKPEEAMGKKAGALWKKPMPSDYYKKMWDVIKNQKETFISEIENKRKNGESYTAKISISPVLDENRNVMYFVAIEHDITKEKEIDKTKTEFVSLASHQLKTPIGSIQWDLEMLMDGDYGSVTAKQKDILSEAYVMSKRMNDLVNALLNISRIEMGVFIIEPKPTDFVQLCEEVISEMKPRILKKGHELVKVFDQDLAKIPADDKLLRVIFQNFISNAIKYTPNGGKIVVAIKADSKDITFSVANNGAPIPDADQSKIFSKMFRASNAQEQDPEGNGLGLYVVKEIVENGGGKIWFTSKNGENTVFACSFPLSGMIAKTGTRQLS